MCASRALRSAALRTAAAVALAGVLLAGTWLEVPPPGGAPAALDATGVIRQRTRDDCGVASVAMLLRGAGRHVDLEELWQSVDVPPGGLSLAQLAELSARHGLAATPIATPDLGALAPAPPWIAHLRWNHYVVIEAVEQTRVVMADPRGYRYSMPLEGFRRAWSGHGLQLAER